VQDNLEFLRCFKNLYEAFYTGQHYDPVAARKDMGAAPSTSANPDVIMPKSPASDPISNFIMMFSLSQFPSHRDMFLN